MPGGRSPALLVLRKGRVRAVLLAGRDTAEAAKASAVNRAVLLAGRAGALRLVRLTLAGGQCGIWSSGTFCAQGNRLRRK